MKKWKARIAIIVLAWFALDTFVYVFVGLGRGAENGFGGRNGDWSGMPSPAFWRAARWLVLRPEK